ncbi:SDR family NAD(P)-dependent oxidoreductase [Variovorax sp. 2RAF20]
MNIRFDNQLVAVSGCVSDIGRAISAAFLAAGAKVYGCDLKASVQLAREIFFSDVDLSNRKAAAAWIQTIENREGRAIDVLVHNAGGVAGQIHRPIERVKDEEWDRVVEINLGSAFALCRSVAPGQKLRRVGAIVVIASGAAQQASLTGVQAYCAAKHGELGLIRQLAHELGPHGIRVNAVAPGFVRTTATQRQWDAMGADTQERVLESVALRRFSEPEDIAHAALFLASQQAKMINGQMLQVDGGR